jgi:hypothetical protein
MASKNVFASLRLACFLMTANFLVTSCDVTVENKASIYPVVTGSFDLNWTPTVTGVHSVEFFVNGVSVGKVTDATNGYVTELDSTKLPNGLQKIGVIARGDVNQTLATVDQTILVQN